MRADRYHRNLSGKGGYPEANNLKCKPIFMPSRNTDRGFPLEAFFFFLARMFIIEHPIEETAVLVEDSFKMLKIRKSWARLHASLGMPPENLLA